MYTRAPHYACDRNSVYVGLKCFPSEFDYTVSGMVYFILFGFHRVHHFRPTYSLAPFRFVPQARRGHIVGSPPPHYGTQVAFYREKDLAFFPLVNSRRCATDVGPSA